MKQRQVFSKEFKLEAVRLLESADRPAAEVARQVGIRRNQLYKWQQELRRRGNGAFQGPGRPSQADDELAQLKRGALKRFWRYLVYRHAFVQMKTAPD